MKINSLDFKYLHKNQIKKNINSNKNVSNTFKNTTNLSYQPIYFARNIKEHKSWGAYVNPDTKEVSFKIFTYPDAKSVKVNIENKDLQIELENKGKGIFQSKEPISPDIVQEGDEYNFEITKQDGSTIKVKDPYSYSQKTLTGNSIIYDHSRFQWSDSDWMTSKKRISRLANPQNQLTSLNQAKILEINTSSFSQTGDFRGISEKLDYIKSLGFNAIELMPVENAYSFNWGYDGVDKFAVSKALGGADELKKLINLAHQKEINVIIDMVPNHIGPDGEMLDETGPYLDGKNCFGKTFNYEGRNSKYVRDYIVNAALNWLNNFHCDGLRLDMTKMMNSDFTMKQIAAEINYHNPHAFLIAEDARSNVSADDTYAWHDHQNPHDDRICQPLKEREYGIDDESHIQAIKNISNNEISLINVGYDSEWDFPLFHAMNRYLLNKSSLDDLEFALNSSNGRVKYVMSHDEIGNNSGTRLIPKIITDSLNLNFKTELNEQDFKRAQKLQQQSNIDFSQACDIVLAQKAQLNGEQLSIMLSEGKFDDITQDDFNYILKSLDIKPNSITTKDIKLAHIRAFSANKLMYGLLYNQSGAKMVFQGDENSSINPFRFFREFSLDKNEDYLYVQKGYPSGTSALIASKPDFVKYSTEAQKYMQGFCSYLKSLNNLSDNISALNQGEIIKQDTVRYPHERILSQHHKCGNSSVYSIFNFSNKTYNKDNKFYIPFPKGNWIEIINSDNAEFMGENNLNTQIITSDGIKKCPVNLAQNSAIIFKKID